MEQRQKPTGNRKKLKPWAIVLLCIAIIVVLVAARYLYVVLVNPMSAFDDPAPSAAPSPTLTPDDEPKASPTPTLSPEEVLSQQADREFMKNRVNILMLGWDQSPEREDKTSALYRDETNNFRSDVIMLLTADFEKNTVDLISVPRDTYAPIYNTTGRWKINAAFAKGGSAKGDGFHYAQETVGDLLGVPIPYYMGVDMSGLKALVDTMGGVDYNVDVKITLNGRVLEKGQQHLNGQQVLDYCRARKGISTDVGRNDRQQRMLFAIFEQLKSKNQLVNLPGIYASLSDMVHTNLNTEQIAALTVFALNLDMDDLNRHTLEGEYISNVYHASFYVLDNEKLAALVKDIFGIQIETKPRYDLHYVQADKDAQSAMAYVEAAQYLESVAVCPVMQTEEQALLVQQIHQDMVDAYTALGNIAQRMVPEDATEEEIEAALDVSLCSEDILAAQERLQECITAFCNTYGVTKAQVEKKQLPSELYKQLPDVIAPDVIAPQVAPNVLPGA